MSDDQDKAEVIKQAARALFALDGGTDGIYTTRGCEPTPAVSVARDAVVRHVAEALGVAAADPAPASDRVLEQRVRRIVKRLRDRSMFCGDEYNAGFAECASDAVRFLTDALDGKELSLIHI